MGKEVWSWLQTAGGTKCNSVRGKLYGGGEPNVLNVAPFKNTEHKTFKGKKTQFLNRIALAIYSLSKGIVKESFTSNFWTEVAKAINWPNERPKGQSRGVKLLSTIWRCNRGDIQQLVKSIHSQKENNTKMSLTTTRDTSGKQSEAGQSLDDMESWISTETSSHIHYQGWHMCRVVTMTRYNLTTMDLYWIQNRRI